MFGTKFSLIIDENDIMMRFRLAIEQALERMTADTPRPVIRQVASRDGRRNEQVRGRATNGLTAPVFHNDIDLRTVELADQCLPAPDHRA
jgi:hypothetical protein